MAIGRKEALDCFRSDDLVGIGMEADAVRRRLHPEGVVSYVIDCTIDYTALIGAQEKAFASVCEQVEAMQEAGGSGVTLHGTLNGGVNVNLSQKIDWFERLFSTVKQSFPAIWMHGLSARAVRTIAENSGVGLGEAIMRMRDAGLDSIAGDGLAKTAEWVEAHRLAHGLGMPTTAAMVFGAGETVEQRVDRLDAVRQLQEETGGFTAFVPMSYVPRDALGGGRELDEATAVESLKTVAIARMMLENIENVQANGATRSLKVLQMALRFGSNDAGPIEQGGDAAWTSEEDLRRVIRDAGFKPVQRDFPYRTMFLD